MTMYRISALLPVSCLLLLSFVVPVSASVMPDVSAEDAQVAGDNSNFQVKVTVKSRQNATYRVHLEETNDFLFINSDGNKEAFVANGGNMSFNFTLRTESDITKGTYEVKYEVYMNDVLTNASSLEVAVDIRDKPQQPNTCGTSFIGLVAMAGSLVALIGCVRWSKRPGVR